MSIAYLYSIASKASIFIMLALSLNIITGYAGQAMMGQAAFFGIGAYTAGILTLAGVNFYLALIGGMLMAGLFGAVLGLISLRLQADFLAITTIGINFIMVALFNKLSITGGSLGLDVPKPVLFGVKMMPMHFFYLTLILIVILCLLIVKMRRSWFGMALASINNDPAAARSFGIDVNRYQILTFTIGTAIAGLAGGIYVHRMECVPNYSEGRDAAKIEKILDCFRGREGVKLLDYSSDKSHNRSVVTLVGEPEALRDAVVDSIGVAIELIDLTKHEGQHPRMGCVDVIPFIPIRNCDVADADAIAKDVARIASERFDFPFFLYEQSASAPHRQNLAEIRKGQFEGMAEKMKDPMWKPDFGPDHPHPTGGVAAIGARPALIAYNVNLDAPDLEIASKIAKRNRYIGGGLRYCKALGVMLEERNIAQVSINMTDFNKTSIYSIVEMVRMEARRYGVNVLGTEVVGLIPMKALIDCAEYYLQIENFSIDQVLESRL